MKKYADDLYEEILDIPAVDIHTHIHAKHISARGLHDVLLYHMVGSELYSAGCPDGDRVAEEIDDTEAEQRILRALPYVRHIRNTSCYWGLRIILKDLYGWEEEITPDNWRLLDGKIRERSSDNSWAREIFKKAGVWKVNTELCKRNGEEFDDLFFYNLEWAFFTRCQWMQFDTALLELEAAWSQDGVGSPLPVNIDRSALNFTKTIRSLDDVHQALDHYIAHIPFDRIHGLPSHYSTDIHYRVVSDREMASAIKKRNHADAAERDIYANYIFEKYLEKLNRLGRKVVLPFSVGAEPLKYETGSKLSSATLFSLAETARKYENIDFIVFSGSEHQDQTLCTLIRQTPNLYAAGFWWHTFFPESMGRIISRRLDMLPTNKWFGLFSDAYCAEWAYAKSIMVRKMFSWELARKVEQGRMDKKLAVDTAAALINDTPAHYFGL